MADDDHSEAEILSQSLIDTQPVLSSQEVGLLYDNEKPKICWGQLYPLYLPQKEPFNLIRNSYSVGRHLSCDLTLFEKDVGQKLHLQISKMQFSINRHPCLPNISYIVDHSTNGTFVNGKKLGKNNKQLLSNDDIISVANSQNKVYAFMEFKAKDDIHEKVKQKYITFGVIGSGAFGEVREVVEKETMKKYAMKLIKMDPSEYDNVFNEIVILYKARHLNIVRMHDLIKTESQLFIVLELMHGDLSHRLKVQKHLSEPVTKHILYQCTLALHYLHKNNIVHRDMKPANILLSSNEEFPIVKIADFGLATILTKSAVQTSTVCGTRPYVAPEMIYGRRITYSKKIDVWSLGVILFYCLSGELPFAKSRHDMPLESQIKSANFSFSNKIWNSVSNKAKDIILNMLVVNPRERISMDGILCHSWIEQDTRMKIRVHEMKEYPKRNILDEDITTEVKRFRVTSDL